MTIGNLTGDPRIALLVDFATRRRLKMFGHARVAFADEEPKPVATLATPSYEAVVEGGCGGHRRRLRLELPAAHRPALHLEELDPVLGRLRHRIATLEAEKRELTALLQARGEDPPAAAPPP